MGAVGGAESGHGDADDAAAVEFQDIKGPHADQQRQGGIETATDAHHHLGTMGMGEAFHQTGRLDAEYLLTGMGHVGRGGDEGPGVDIAQQPELPIARGRGMHHAGMMARLGCREGGVHAALGAQALDVHLTDNQLGLILEATALTYQMTVLIDIGIAAIHHVLGTLSVAATAVDITTHQPGTLLGEQRAEIMVLADEVIRGGEIEDEVGTSQ